ncbi:hypothetical protein RchiOBHm_Chr6g0266741 [Rosa chinensis]|uniref:Uncharacterized protein n=1 Tax=Rosa chinensis TaxID=74649 RepID=A0A2P6PPQ7_ROSCH|nr:hypothetical protein RchiOBHm_Chr6g0266741 [Rosa chinensis]
MFALVEMWSNETKEQSQKDQTIQTLSANASASSSTDVVVNQAKGEMSSSTLLALVFSRVVRVNSLLTHYLSEASVSMLVDWFSS